jgi:tRNA(Ile)-lysidine synthase
LRAIHINHGLNPDAAKWSEQCEADCRHLKIEFHQKTINAKSTLGQSPEEIARCGRYAVFAAQLAVNDFLLTAHQQDDQAETLLLQLFRGAGPKGLSAMPMIKPFAAGFHARPLLDFTRHDLKQYAKEHQLHWIEDESNANTDFTRNFLRHDIMPLLKTRWPTVSKTLSRVASLCAETSEIIEEVAKKDLQESQQQPILQLSQQTNRVPSRLPNSTLSVKKLFELTPARQRQVLRAWISELGFPLPSALKLKQIQQDFLNARHDKLPHIQWKQVELRRYNHHLYLMKQMSRHNSSSIFQWDMQQPLVLPDIGELRAIKNIAEVKKVIVRFRQGGEVCQLPGRKHHHELKKLFQQWDVPPWERDRVPLIYLNNQLIAVVGYFQDEAFFLSTH